MTTSRFWSAIYKQIEEEQWRIRAERGQDGIMIDLDPLALRFQRLARVANHVGCHGFSKRDKEHGMKKAKCFFALFPEPPRFVK